MNHWLCRALHVGYLSCLLVLLSGCDDERPAGIPEGVLAQSEAIDVAATRDGARCSLGTITRAESRQRVAKNVSHLPDWPVVETCETQFCNDIVASWRTGTLTAGELGVCPDRVTVHIPGPQGCGRRPPPDQLEELRQALQEGAAKRGAS